MSRTGPALRSQHRHRGSVFTRPGQVDVDDLVDPKPPGCATTIWSDSRTGSGDVMGDEHDGALRFQPDLLQVLPATCASHSVEVVRTVRPSQDAGFDGEGSAMLMQLLRLRAGRETASGGQSDQVVEQAWHAAASRRVRADDEVGLSQRHGEPRILEHVADPGLIVILSVIPRCPRSVSMPETMASNVVYRCRKLSDDGDEGLAGDGQRRPCR